MKIIVMSDFIKSSFRNTATASAESDTNTASYSTGTYTSGHDIPKAIKYMTTISGQKQISLERSFYAHCHPKGLEVRMLSVIIYSTAKTTQASMEATQSGQNSPYSDKEKEQTKKLILFNTTPKLCLN